MNLPIQFPFGGQDENQSFSAQPSNTSRRIMNMRGVDPVTKRLRGATRSGTSAAVSTHERVDGGGADKKVLAIDQISYNNKTLTYTASESAGVMPTTAVDWSAKSSTGTSVYNVKYDTAGNSYSLDAKNTVIKRNSKGQATLTISVPIEDPQHVCRALYVDSSFSIYVGVTEGGDQSKCRIWKWIQTPDLSQFVVGTAPKQTAQLLWTYETKGYIAKIEVIDSVMYWGENDAQQFKSKVVAAGNLNSGLPTVLWSSKAAYPVRGITVLPSNGVASSSPQFAARNTNPLDANQGYLTDQGIWTPLNLTDASKRIWGWWDAERIDGGKPGSDTYTQGETINVWTDLSGNGRDLYADNFYTLTGSSAGSGSNFGPTYNSKGLSGKPTVSFAGNPNNISAAASVDGTNQSMVSGSNTASQKLYKDQQRSMLPGYASGLFAIVMVFRSAVNATGGKSHCQAVLSQEFLNPVSNYRGIVVNSSATITNATGICTSVAAAGQVGIFDNVAINATPASVIQNGLTLSNGSDILTGGPVIVTWFCDGSTSTSTFPAPVLATDGETRSMFRVNGTHVNRWKSAQSLASLRENMIAGRQSTFDLYAAAAASLGDCIEFAGLELAEAIAFQDYQASEPKIMSHPTSAYTGEGQCAVNTYVPTTANGILTTDLERIEGYLAHKWGIPGRLPANHPFDSVAPLPTSSSPNVNVLNTTNGIVAIYRPSDGALQAYYASNSWLGLDCQYAPDVNIVDDSSARLWTIGNDNPPALFGATLLTYVPGAFTLTATNTPICGTTTSEYPRIGTDLYGNAYVPMLGSAAADAGFAVIDSSSVVYEYYTVSAASVVNQGAHACDARKLKVSDSETDIAKARPEFCIVGLNATSVSGAQQSFQIQSIRQFTTAANGNQPRVQVSVAVSNGAFRKWTSSAFSSPAGAGSLTNPVFDTNAEYVWTIAAYGAIWSSDGKSYRKFNAKTDLLSEWKATSAGEIPQRCRLGCLWRGRAVLARSEDAPQEWYMSRVGDFEDFDYFPPTFTSDVAVASTNSKSAGKVPDVVTALIPYNDDLLLFGCDSSIYRMTGDPAAGGQVDLVSDVTGIAFGKSWCKDPEGVIYFFGSQGGVWAMAPNGSPVSITRNRIEGSMQSVNLLTHRPVLHWNDADDGLHVVFVAWGSATVIKDWFWERKSKAWLPDRFDRANIQPTALFSVDGDQPGDRYTVIGREDGRLAKWDSSAKSDVGATANERVPIDSHFMVGPLAPDEAEMDFRFTGFTPILSPSQDGAYYRLFATNTPEPPLYSGVQTLGPVSHAAGEFKEDPIQWPSGAGYITPGRNFTSMERMKGAYCFVLVGNSTPGARFAWESGSIQAHQAGRKRYV
jgi:hypothetical protein